MLRPLLVMSGDGAWPHLATTAHVVSRRSPPGRAPRARAGTPLDDSGWRRRHTVAAHTDRLDNTFECEVRPASGLDDDPDIGCAELVEDGLVSGDEQRAQIGDVSSPIAQLLGDSSSALACRGYVAFRDTGQVTLDEKRTAGLGHAAPLPPDGGALPDAAHRSDGRDARAATCAVASGVPTCL